ncbi:cupin-like domain-containing protein [Janthinobacterium sp.]|uniref:cupin-like domain-containing protein n=1 Tax=Janthinobacterium sp. TaxID=1871054 RepID=UPI00293D9836|nr:cupin-like domain-containing protein [Janthinobacterium sp.]
MYRVRSPAPELSHEWRRWIAENLILGTHPASLIPLLLQNGIAERDAVTEVELALRSPYIEGAGRLKNRLAKRDWVLEIQSKLNRLSAPRIARRQRLSGEEFLADYYSANRPVIITGMMDDWPALQKWTPDYFRANYAGREVEVQFGRDADQDYELNSIAHKRKMPFGAYVDLVQNSGSSNDFYMTANNDSLNRQALTELWADIGQLPEYLAREAQPRGFFWFGPAGTVTPFHHDLTNNFMAQVFGRKRVRIIPACEVAKVYNQRHCFSLLDGRAIDLARFPDAAGAQVLECVLEPGEILFLPVGCWHFVEALDISATIAFINFHWDNDFYSNYPSKHEF